MPKLRARKYARCSIVSEYFRFEFTTTVNGTGFTSLAHRIEHNQLLNGHKTDRFRGIVENNFCFINSMDGVSSRRVCAISEQIVVSSTR
jgi:hypothetical protein